LYQAIESFAAKLDQTQPTPQSDPGAGSQVAKDLATIAAGWAKAKLEKPTLEAELLRAEITAKYAEAVRSSREAELFEVQRDKLRTELRHEGVENALIDLRRIMEVLGAAAPLLAGQDADTLRIGIGLDANELRPPG
jgi:hypothetical protein